MLEWRGIQCHTKIAVVIKSNVYFHMLQFTRKRWRKKAKLQSLLQSYFILS